jgi:hypothetical protein
VIPEADPEKIIRKGKTPQEGTSTIEPGIFDDFHFPTIGTLISCSHIPIIQSIGVSRSLKFGSVLVEFFPPGLGLEGEILVTPLSPEITLWIRTNVSEDFSTSSFTTPPPITVAATTERETYFPASPLNFSPNFLLFPFPPRSSTPISPTRTHSPPPHIPMAGANPPRNIMDTILAARYAPLILNQPLNALPAGGYLKQLPKFTGEGDITAEEHLVAFYSYANNYVIVDEDVWMSIFVHSLDGEAKKWFRALTPGSIDGIEALDDVFLREWGDKKDFMYYITKFGSLKRKGGEFVSDFSKRFKKMYNKIPIEIKPTKASAKITYANAFDPDFCLLLRERRATSPAHMQDAALEVDSNILAVDRLRNKADRGRGRSEASTSSSSTPPPPPPTMEEVSKLLNSLSARMERLELEGKQTYKNPQNVDNRGNFKR